MAALKRPKKSHLISESNKKNPVFPLSKIPFPLKQRLVSPSGHWRPHRTNQLALPSETQTVRSEREACSTSGARVIDKRERNYRCALRPGERAGFGGGVVTLLPLTEPSLSRETGLPSIPPIKNPRSNPTERRVPQMPSLLLWYPPPFPPKKTNFT